MRKNIDMYESVEEQETEELIMTALELSDFIEERINVRGRKSKAAIKEVNLLIDKYNETYGHTYTKLK